MPLLRKPGRFPGIVVQQKPDQPSEISADPEAPELTDEQIVAILEGYRTEAEYARLAGPNSRDLTWLQHLDLYYNRWDFSKKAPWQSREVLPEFPQFIDRFAAAMKMALIAAPDFFYPSVDNDKEGVVADVIRKFMKVILRRIGRNTTGQAIDFSHIFEEAMKMGAMSLPAAVVTYKDDGEGGYTSVDVEDPYNIWFDPTGRGLYRIRRVEMDLHEFRSLMNMKDEEDNPYFRRDTSMAALNEATAIEALMRAEREKRTGTGQWTLSSRRPIVLHEYYCTIIDNQGFCHGKNVLCVVANNRYLVRGPEKNPFWHQHDWLVAAPIITVPLAPYGRAYAENFSSLVKTFNEMTNLILDGIMATTMKVFTVVPGFLEDPSQINEGIYPNALFRLIEGVAKPDEFMGAVDMGTLDPQAFQVWQVLKKELQEGAAFNEMTLGNSAPKGRTSATEIDTIDTNSTNYMRAIAANIEKGFLEPLLDNIWRTAVQHLSPQDTELQDAIGDEWFQTILSSKKQFATYKITFVCQGITNMLARKQQLQEVLQFLSIVGQSQPLTQVMLQKYSPDKLFTYLAQLMGIDQDRLEMTPQEQMMFQMQQQEQAQAQQQVEAQQTEAEGTNEFKTQARLKVLDHLLKQSGPEKGMVEAGQIPKEAAVPVAMAMTKNGGGQNGPPGQGGGGGKPPR